MKLKNLFVAGSIALLPVVASAASIFIPVAGAGPGANFSQWETELTFHNTTNSAVPLTLLFHDQNGVAGSSGITIAARSTVSIEDVVRSKFGLESATGAIEIVTPASLGTKRIVITSRTSNVTAAGEFGHDVPALLAEDAANEGDVAVLNGPSAVASARFNFGLYALEDTTVRWDLVRADGTIAATRELEYEASTQRQYNYGVSAVFNQAAQDNDVVKATVLEGAAMFYGSVINQASGDPSFVPGVKTRADAGVRFAGIDLDENGTIDVGDANGDGVLDAPIDVLVGLFPNYFRVVAASETNESLTYEIASSTADAALTDAAGTVQMYPGVGLRGTEGVLRVRVKTASGLTQVLTIPVRFI